MQHLEYEKLSDEELIKRLITTPTENKLHDYFFKKKCHNFLLYISRTLYNEETTYHLMGEFYEFLSNDNWKVIRMWKKENNCSLYTYLSTCATRYFTNRVKEEKQRAEIEFVPQTPEFIEYMNNLSNEENEREKIIWDAFNVLKKRDQIVLRSMVIENCNAIDIAPMIWKYIRCKESYENLSAKKIQNTIAMVKHRALLAMFNNFKKLNVY